MNPLTMLHILAGSIALLAGAGALLARKGSPWHRRVGTAFFGAMLAMAGTGAVIAALKPERGTAVIGVLTCYLVATAWAAARGRDGRARRFEYSALLLALACVSVMFLLGYWGMSDPRGRIDSLPYQVHFVFGGIAALAAGFDVNFILRGQLSGHQRIARHLWRMCLALLIAAASFFQGQQDEFPEALRGLPLWYLPPLAVLAAMLFWIFRVRFSKAYRKWPPRIAAKAASPASAEASKATA
ncbi:MAG: DUF2306 domain-containing protein [Sphingosinicella sp.]|uniref:DUF2306 domain-containing protein n=1 Tax=Sphingosinicella sp. TaxID=1917971 RepID=UPI004037F33E